MTLSPVLSAHHEYTPDLPLGTHFAPSRSAFAETFTFLPPSKTCFTVKVTFLPSYFNTVQLSLSARYCQ